MAYAPPLYVEHSIRRRERTTDQEKIRRLTQQVNALQRDLQRAKKEIEYLTCERDELVSAIKDWASDRA